jgi:hypothetical protein
MSFPFLPTEKLLIFLNLLSFLTGSVPNDHRVEYLPTVETPK